ncbi:MAG: peptide deformylase [Candidatus Sungbacteria bacterium]|uniref:Peptide deformylase n=1 Tax=Candidatus Sungiibacteriota bacterium TaxID=2750080 RepID=A0A931SB22_9BACT|nr:peptide deformylase [Candidatus Sungbacteria bacterium]
MPGTCRPIITEPNPVLRRRSEEVLASSIPSAEIRKVIADLKATLAQSEDGIGIAAPQIGISLRIFVVSEEAKFVDRRSSTAKEVKKNWEPYVYINPEIKKFSVKKSESIEGCLSLPGKFGIVSRPDKISIEALDEHGQKIHHGASKFFARVLQHEMDHLNGILFIDKATRFVNVAKNNDRL